MVFVFIQTWITSLSSTCFVLHHLISNMISSFITSDCRSLTMLKVLWGHKKGHVPFCNETKFKFMSRWNWTTTWEKKAVNEVINIDLLKISFLSLKKKCHWVSVWDLIKTFTKLGSILGLAFYEGCKKFELTWRGNGQSGIIVDNK